MGCHGSGVFTAGNTLQKSTIQALERIDKQIDNIKVEKKEWQEGINDIIRFTPPNERDATDKRLLNEYKEEIRKLNSQIADLEDEKKQVKKAGRKENKGQLTFFSMRNSK